MPIYDYRCSDKECNHIMEDQRKGFDDKVIVCEKCGSDSNRLFSGMFAAHGLPNGHNAVRTKRY